MIQGHVGGLRRLRSRFMSTGVDGQQSFVLRSNGEQFIEALIGCSDAKHVLLAVL